VNLDIYGPLDDWKDAREQAQIERLVTDGDHWSRNACIARGPRFEVEEDGGDDRRIGQQREDPHLAATGGTEQRQHVVDASEQDGPSDFHEAHDLRPDRIAQVESVVLV
jgi:hypothetical protein